MPERSQDLVRTRRTRGDGDTGSRGPGRKRPRAVGRGAGLPGPRLCRNSGPVSHDFGHAADRASRSWRRRGRSLARGHRHWKLDLWSRGDRSLFGSRRSGGRAGWQCASRQGHDGDGFTGSRLHLAFAWQGPAGRDPRRCGRALEKPTHHHRRHTLHRRVDSRRRHPRGCVRGRGQWDIAHVRCRAHRVGGRCPRRLRVDDRTGGGVFPGAQAVRSGDRFVPGRQAYVCRDDRRTRTCAKSSLVRRAQFRLHAR